MADHKKIGIMGGTFNPIHFGHLLLAETAFHQFQLDEILIMPTKNPYYKKISNSVTEEDRVAMAELAIEDNGHFRLSKEELNKRNNVGTSIFSTASMLAITRHVTVILQSIVCIYMPVACE